jgi:hypothetical protein
MIIAAFAGAGKTTFAAMYPDLFTDFECMPYKYYLPEQEGEVDETCKANFDNVMRDEWPHNYVEAIKKTLEDDDEKILIIPSDSWVLRLLREENIEYSLCYPVREAKEVYRQRYIDRGNTEDFLYVFIDGWERFMDKLESDPTIYRYVMEPHQYLSDVIALLHVSVCKSSTGTEIKICDALAMSANTADDDGEELPVTYSIGPETPEPIELGTKLSEVPKYWSNGPKPPKDEELIMVAEIRSGRMQTSTKALATLQRLELLDKYLQIPDWAARSPKEVTTYLNGHEDGICINGDVIAFGSESLDRESMEVLCTLDLLGKPLGGWHNQ